MMNKTYKLILGFAFLLIVGLTGANAQIPGDSIIKAEIPFSFVLREKIYPAGEYTIKATDSGADADTVLEITNDKGREKPVIFQTVATSENEAQKNSNLVFDKYGDNYFLSKIFVAGETSGSEVEKSKMEKQMEKGGKMTKEKYVLKVGRWKVIEKIEKK